MHHNQVILVCGNDGLVTYFLIVPASTFASDYTPYLVDYAWSSVPSSASAVPPAWCSFNGVTCDEDAESLTYLSVTQIELHVLDLKGTLPNSVGSLTSLVHFGVGINKLGGTIPDSIGSMSSLTLLTLDRNSFTGTIPASIISNCKSLKTVFLFRNELTGTVPNLIGSLTSMTHLDLGNNLLIGTIPESIGSVSSLTFLGFGYNAFTGTIPASIISKCTSLAHLYFDGNTLTGTIPTTFSKLTNLFDLNLSNNYLTMGSATSVPESTFSAMTLSHYLATYNNCLTFRNEIGTHCKPTSSKLCNQIY